jgi:hypothetical protein
LIVPFLPFNEWSALAYTESSEEAKGVEVGGVCSTKVVGAHVSLDPVRPRPGNCDVHTLQLNISGGDSHSYAFYFYLNIPVFHLMM